MSVILVLLTPDKASEQSFFYFLIRQKFITSTTTATHTADVHHFPNHDPNELCLLGVLPISVTRFGKILTFWQKLTSL